MRKEQATKGTRIVLKGTACFGTILQPPDYRSAAQVRWESGREENINVRNLEKAPTP